ncbi:MAG: hypothetical protein IJO88_03060 [Oscillospiraceae bacterium]|nr:hypothetical protein [Oscillospiraceae bacterium]
MFTIFLQEATMHEDTIALLSACTAGIDLTVSAIDRLTPTIADHRLRQKLHEGREDHQLLRDHASRLLAHYGGAERPPAAAVRGLQKLRTDLRMALGGDDTTAAYLVAGRCDTAVRSLSRSQNRHCLANTDALLLTQELIRCEESLSARLRPYL